MVWAATVPPAVQGLKDMLALVAAWTSWTNVALHYPQSALGVEHGTPDTFPHGVVVPDEARRTPYAAGAAALAGGRLTLLLYTDVLNAAELETKAEAILAGLCALYVGLPNLSGSVGIASDPLPGQRAAANGGQTACQYRTIAISLTYGLRPP